jgi:hypothetical protein
MKSDEKREDLMKIESSVISEVLNEWGNSY